MNRIVLFSVLTVLAILIYAFGFTSEITDWQEAVFWGTVKILFLFKWYTYSELGD